MNAEIRERIRHDDIRYDPWGTAMSWRFGIAEALYVHGEDVPNRWQYRPGLDVERAAQGDDYVTWADENYLAADLEDDLERGTFSVRELHHAGDVLARYCRMLEHYGRDC
jgi:hypothetical protein